MNRPCFPHYFVGGRDGKTAVDDKCLECRRDIHDGIHPIGSERPVEMFDRVRRECDKLRAERDEALKKLLSIYKRHEHHHILAEHCYICLAASLLRKHGLLEERHD